MSWELARVVLSCHRCRNTIGVQQPARRGVIASTLTWCEACAGIEFDEVPPGDLGVVEPSTSLPMRGHTGVLARDGRMAATGERE